MKFSDIYIYIYIYIYIWGTDIEAEIQAGGIKRSSTCSLPGMQYVHIVYGRGCDSRMHVRVI